MVVNTVSIASMINSNIFLLHLHVGYNSKPGIKGSPGHLWLCVGNGALSVSQLRMWPALMAAAAWSTDWACGRARRGRRSSRWSLKPWRTPGRCCMRRDRASTASPWCWRKDACCSTTNKVQHPSVHKQIRFVRHPAGTQCWARRKKNYKENKMLKKKCNFI